MGLTVKRLISELKQMPQNAEVVVCAHDQDPESGEFDGAASHVSEAPLAVKERGYGVVIYLG